jgi:hypothetical protein
VSTGCGIFPASNTRKCGVSVTQKIRAPRGIEAPGAIGASNDGDGARWTPSAGGADLHTIAGDLRGCAETLHAASSTNDDPLAGKRLTPRGRGSGSIAGRVVLKCLARHPRRCDRRTRYEREQLQEDIGPSTNVPRPIERVGLLCWLAHDLSGAPQHQLRATAGAPLSVALLANGGLCHRA